MKRQRGRRLKGGGFLILCGVALTPEGDARNVEFNIDVLDVQDRENIDLTPFAQPGYVMPGNYLLDVKINGQSISIKKIIFREVGEAASLPQARLTKDLVNLFALKKSYQDKLVWREDGGLDFTSLAGMQVKADLGTSVLNITVPQIYLEYTSTDWDPPARWDNGLAGMLLDYSLNAASVRSTYSGSQNSLTGSGTLGGNIGAWRLRADWQLKDMLADHPSANKGLDVTRYYLYRALPGMRAKVTLGENYLTSSIFDSFRFIGGTLESDVTQLPPSLRGYAPEVNGVADSNATVIVSQQGRVLYQTQVPPGPFSIQDLHSSVNGLLDVEIREQDGKTKKFQIATASLPYLTRPGAVRYKLFTGRPNNLQHAVEGPIFTAAEASWGVTNGWSLYGGGLGTDGYQSLSLGIGRDLYKFGALSSDVTFARRRLADGTRQGKSFRVSYAKTFEELGSQVTFAGYRFSEKEYYSMAEYLSARQYQGNYRGNSKERYDISFNQRFTDLGITAFLNYSHQSYWDRPASDRFELSVSTYLELLGLKNVSVSARAYHQNYNRRNDNGLMLSLNLPWGDKGYVNYSGTHSTHSQSHSVGYSGRTEKDDSYNLRATHRQQENELSGYWNRRSNLGDITLSGSGSTASRSAASLGLNGGLTATRHGVVLHGSGYNGSTRLLIGTDGVAGVPLQGGGRSTMTNQQGLAVFTGINSYTRTHTSVALNKLGDDLEASNSVTQLTLTEGAIGYRTLDVIAGRKGMATIRMQDGSVPPFGATVFTAQGKNAGIVGDDGIIWLSGMKPDETMRVQWDSKQCDISLPHDLSDIGDNALLLPCVISESKA